MGMATLSGPSRSNTHELLGLWRLNLYSKLRCWSSVCGIYQSYYLAMSSQLGESCLPQYVCPRRHIICITSSCSVTAVQ